MPSFTWRGKIASLCWSNNLQLLELVGNPGSQFTVITGQSRVTKKVYFAEKVECNVSVSLSEERKLVFLFQSKEFSKRSDSHAMMLKILKMKNHC